MTTLQKHYVGIGLAIVLTALSYGAGVLFNWTMTTGWLLYVELFSVLTSYWCTYLCVVQTRTNYPIGAVSVVALCLLFWQQKLYGSMALQVWLFPWLVYGFWRWRPDADTRPVTLAIHDRWQWLVAYIAIPTVCTVLLVQINTLLGGTNSVLDTLVLVLSILAQFLLDNKKLENWLVWIAVDVISVIDYWPQDLKILSIQMGLFALNAVWGFYLWNQSRAKPVSLKLAMPHDNW